ncbi:VOC family protein [Paenibacillus sp. Marseille-Q4541]|uniref:VOC family protein n=1 Tax=Paenibacillus sp. Marseille-Q4541 TaxID=2831522 RepID=UPI001BABBCEC|nr:VOC family protein [Paenibacillus sp. Marseille-Q4541]
MINKIGQVMLYVSNQDESKGFWTEKLGFEVITEEINGPMKWIEVAPKGAATSIVLHNKEFVAQMNPEMNLGTPSLMYFTDNFDQLYSDLKSKNVTVGEIVELPTGRVFNFADNEQNYFAVMEK